MAIVHIATKAISRKAGQSAVASAAYRAGVILKDERYDKSHDYSKKSGVMSADIILPSALKAKGLMVSREEIWNKAEHVEGRTDSRVAREWLINLPYELDETKRKILAHEFAQTLADKYNIIADCSIHAPSKKEVARGADPRNYHAHILVTTREAKLDADGKLFFDKQFKIPFEWSNKKRDDNGLQSSIQEIKDIRQLWVDMANKALAELDLAPLDARSFKDQGLDRLPTIKMGVDATNMERKGIRTDKGNENRAIHVINARKEIIAETRKRHQGVIDERHTNEHIEWASERIEWAANRHQHIVKRIDDNQSRISHSQQRINLYESETEDITRRLSDKDSIDAGGISGQNRNDSLVTDAAGQQERTNQLITKRTRALAAAPSPFDDNARRARATSLAEQQKQLDRDAEEYDRRAKYYSGIIENAVKRADDIRLNYALKFLGRHGKGKKLETTYHESSDDYPDKLDDRQINILDTFAQELNLNRVSGEDLRDYTRKIISLFTREFVKENKAMISLAHNPKAERAEYDTVKLHYDNFIEELDKNRKDTDNRIKKELGNLGEVSRLTAECLSATNYLEALDNHINNNATAAQNKDLANQHRTKTISLTCAKFKYGLIELRNIRTADSFITHSESLQASLDTFIGDYGSELSESLQDTINEGLRANKQQAQSNSRRLRR